MEFMLKILNVKEDNWFLRPSLKRRLVWMMAKHFFGVNFL
jgi:hypothetical protein